MTEVWVVLWRSFFSYNTRMHHSLLSFRFSSSSHKHKCEKAAFKDTETWGKNQHLMSQEQPRRSWACSSNSASALSLQLQAQLAHSTQVLFIVLITVQSFLIKLSSLLPVALSSGHQTQQSERLTITPRLCQTSVSDLLQSLQEKTWRNKERWISVYLK